MTTTSPSDLDQPLRVGSIIGDAFGIFFSRFLKVFVIGMIGGGLIFLTAWLLNGWTETISNTGITNVSTPQALIANFVNTGIGMVVYALMTGVIVQMTYDAKLDRKRSLWAYMLNALPAALPIALMSLLVSFLSVLGAVALFVGALWVLAAFYVMVPVAVIERQGFGSLRRSFELTRGFRWPIVGVMILFFIIGIVISLPAVGIAQALLSDEIFSLFSSSAGRAAITVLELVTNGVVYAFGGIATGLVYARLREIKEGVGVEDIAAVFD
jgi:hypothetical protein